MNCPSSGTIKSSSQSHQLDVSCFNKTSKLTNLKMSPLMFRVALRCFDFSFQWTKNEQLLTLRHHKSTLSQAFWSHVIYMTARVLTQPEEDESFFFCIIKAESLDLSPGLHQRRIQTRLQSGTCTFTYEQEGTSEASAVSFQNKSSITTFLIPAVICKCAFCQSQPATKTTRQLLFSVGALFWRRSSQTFNIIKKCGHLICRRRHMGEIRNW